MAIAKGNYASISASLLTGVIDPAEDAIINAYRANMGLPAIATLKELHLLLDTLSPGSEEYWSAIALMGEILLKEPNEIRFAEEDMIRLYF